MSRNRLAVSVAGAVTGAVVAVAITAFIIGIRALGSVDLVVTDLATTNARPVLSITNGSFYLALVVAGLAGGALVGATTYVLGRMTSPSAPRFPLKYLLPTAAVMAAIVLYAVMRASVGLGGSIEDGIVSISAFRLVLGAGVAGFVTGGITAGTTDALARPAFLGLDNEAWPASSAAFVRESVRAMMAPMIGLGVVAALALGVSQVLLSSSHTGAVVLASVLSAAVLAGAALVAYRPWDRGEPGGGETPLPG
ncbi:MAG: hypothetical protein HKO87_05645 [Acidimicrobiia bacterium]|nr:hypothetical protein [Acidimicrobiia bacterium]NNK91898.1 hypothetical protein [Acidimicrobiia bacterium]